MICPFCKKDFESRGFKVHVLFCTVKSKPTQSLMKLAGRFFMRLLQK